MNPWELLMMYKQKLDERAGQAEQGIQESLEAAGVSPEMAAYPQQMGAAGMGALKALPHMYKNLGKLGLLRWGKTGREALSPQTQQQLIREQAIPQLRRAQGKTMSQLETAKSWPSSQELKRGTATTIFKERLARIRKEMDEARATEEWLEKITGKKPY